MCAVLRFAEVGMDLCPCHTPRSASYRAQNIASNWNCPPVGWPCVRVTARSRIVTASLPKKPFLWELDLGAGSGSWIWELELGAESGSWSLNLALSPTAARSQRCHCQ